MVVLVTKVGGRERTREREKERKQEREREREGQCHTSSERLVRASPKFGSLVPR
jgi:hypothetical protein